jgi:Na+-transporting NADH:ubiquinone oxidoreductase subunit NqrB
MRDARLFQIVFLGTLLGVGVLFYDFTLRPIQMLLAFVAALLTQAICLRRLRLGGAGYRSTCITALGLSILLRADNYWVHPLAAAAAIAAKFLVRVQGKHLFNPANLGVVLALLLLPGSWVSPGQWGHELVIIGWCGMFGLIVVHRARRSDISLAFLALYLMSMALRVAWLGQPWAVWWHQLTNGTLLLFTFFMISDPMTIPNRRFGRIVHAAVVVALHYLWSFHFYKQNGLILSLFAASLLVPLWDKLWPEGRYQWLPPKEGENKPCVTIA